MNGNGNLKERLWVDGCFDFFHHGHAGALMQARQFGTELYVGIHSDEEILKNKGPVVMYQPEREMAVEACKWSTKCIPDSPYVTSPDWMDSFKCQYVVHGDDITTDANGFDCYQEMKDLGRFLVVKRTPNISTTDLIGRMLSSSKSHHLPSVTTADTGHFLLKKEQTDRMTAYATAADAKSAYSAVYALQDATILRTLVEPSPEVAKGLKSRAYYVSGSWDLFHPGHMDFLRQVKRRAEADGALVVVGIMDDQTVNQSVGENYPVMNLFERTLCCLQCRFIDAVVLGVPFSTSKAFLGLLDGIQVVKVLRGPTLVTSNKGMQQTHADPNGLGDLFLEIPGDEYQYMETSEIVTRVLTHRRMYEERQRKKGVKAEHERAAEAMEKHRNA